MRKQFQHFFAYNIQNIYVDLLSVRFFCLLCPNDYSKIFHQRRKLKLLLGGSHVGCPLGRISTYLSLLLLKEVKQRGCARLFQKRKNTYITFVSKENKHLHQLLLKGVKQQRG